MFPKLVRDFIPKIITEKQKGIPCFHRASNEEYWIRLKEKLLEEVNEFIDSEDDIDELADIIEVMDAIIAFKQMSLEEIILIKNRKAELNGTFKDRIVLDSIK